MRKLRFIKIYTYCGRRTLSSTWTRCYRCYVSSMSQLFLLQELRLCLARDYGFCEPSRNSPNDTDHWQELNNQQSSHWKSGTRLAFQLG